MKTLNKFLIILAFTSFSLTYPAQEKSNPGVAAVNIAWAISDLVNAMELLNTKPFVNNKKELDLLLQVLNSNTSALINLNTAAQASEQIQLLKKPFDILQAHHQKTTLGASEDGQITLEDAVTRLKEYINKLPKK